MIVKKYTKEYQYLTTNFDCGNYVINNFLKSSNALDPNQGITYLLLSDDEKQLIGYYNIEVGRLDCIQNIGSEQSYQFMGGTVHINYLAIHKDFKGKKIAEVDERNIYLGDILLDDCEQRIVKLREDVGVSFITLCSTEEGYHLYKMRNSYEDFEDDMSIFIQERDIDSYKMYKCIDEIVKN